jgi:hypothetical protein
MDLLKSLKSEKQFFVLYDKGVRKQFYIAQVRPYYNDPLEAHVSRDTGQILVSETMSSTDRRALSPEAAAAKRKEIDGLIARNTWKIFSKQDVRDSVNILGGRCILTIKDVNNWERFF